MKIRTLFTPSELDPAGLADATVVVIDVVRATTSIVEALANGAGGVYPTVSTEDAVKLAQSLGREDTILCGERRGVKVEGFDLGNSPAEFTRETVAGKKLVMSTTNGTVALAGTNEARRVLVGAFTNLDAVAASVLQASPADGGVDGNGGSEASESLVVLLCAGRAGGFSIDDALCAGHLIRRIVDEADEEPVLDDASWAASALAGELTPTRDLLEHTAAGRGLDEIGLADDLDLCADVDRHDIVPVMVDQAITVPGVA